MLQYDPRVGNYRKNGKLVSRSEVRKLVQLEQKNLLLELQREVRRYQLNSINLSQFQLNANRLLKESNLRMGLLAIGGKNRLQGDFKNQWLGLLGNGIKEAYKSIQTSIQRILRGDLNIAQLNNRMRYLANGVLINFYTAEKAARVNEGFNFGWRSLDPGAASCEKCPLYETGGWVNLEDIVTPGSDCPCGGNCKCILRYKKDYREQDRADN
jgi:hypothetical protein